MILNPNKTKALWDCESNLKTTLFFSALACAAGFINNNNYYSDLIERAQN